MNQQVIINVGVSWGGKSTFTTDFIKKNPNFVRINRDDIRKLIFGEISEDYYTSEALNWRENIVTEVEESIFMGFLIEELNVIIDNTNLKPAYIKKWIDMVNEYSSSDIDIKFKIFPEENALILKRRISRREKIPDLSKLGYIDKQIASLKNIIDYISKNYTNQILK